MNTQKYLAVLITGASSGLGLEFAHILAKDSRYKTIVLVARREDRLNRIAEKLTKLHPDKNFLVRKTDLTVVEERTALFEYIKKEELILECLINNAGFGSYGFFEDSDLNKELNMIELNCSALVDLTHRSLKGMLERKSGFILNVSSMASFQGLPYLSTYSATKAFVTSFSLALATELSKSGIKVHALCPGPVPTEFLHVSGFPEKISVVPSISAKAVCESAVNRLFQGKRITIPGLLNKILAQLPRLVPRSLAPEIALAVLKKKF